MFHCSFQAELLPLMSFLSGNSCCSMKVNERKPDSVSIYSLATSFLPLVFFPFPPTYLFFLLEMKLSCAHYLRSRYQKQIHPSKEFYDGLRQSHWWLSPESCQILHVRKHLQISWTQTGFPETTRFSHGLVKAILPLNKQNFPTAGPGSPGCGHSNLQLKLSFRISPNRRGWLPTPKAPTWCSRGQLQAQFISHTQRELVRTCKCFLPMLRKLAVRRTRKKILFFLLASQSSDQKGKYFLRAYTIMIRRKAPLCIICITFFICQRPYLQNDQGFPLYMKPKLRFAQRKAMN